METSAATVYLSVFLLALLELAVAQSQGYTQKPVAILTEQRYLSGNGQFGAAYTQEDGINFKEETDEDGTRHGSYSYIDPTGQRREISYTAGKNGFQPKGDHLVVPPIPQPVAPQPYNEPKIIDGYEDGSYDTRYNNPNYNSPINNKPTYSSPNYNTRIYNSPNNNAPNYNAPPSYTPPKYNAPKYSPPKYNTADYDDPIDTKPNYNAPNYNTQNFNNPTYNRPSYVPTTTQSPRPVFMPPGQFSLNRTPDGFTYSFKQT